MSGDRILVGRDFPHPSRPALPPTQPPVQWVPCILPAVKRQGSGVDHYPFLKPRLKKEWIYTCNPLWAFVTCSRVSFTFTFVLLKRKLKVLWFNVCVLHSIYVFYIQCMCSTFVKWILFRIIFEFKKVCWSETFQQSSRRYSIYDLNQSDRSKPFKYDSKK